nr:PREDICTED: uncharacterized protein LOC105663265 [Megachile rotundata]
MKSGGISGRNITGGTASVKMNEPRHFLSCQDRIWSVTAIDVGGTRCTMMYKSVECSKGTKEFSNDPIPFRAKSTPIPSRFDASTPSIACIFMDKHYSSRFYKLPARCDRGC